MNILASYLFQSLAEVGFDAAAKQQLAGFVGGLILFALGVAAWKMLTGQKETESREITPQPLKVQHVDIYITETELNRRIEGLATRQELTAMELRIEHSLSEQFQSLDQKRSVSIAGLHRRIEDEARRAADKLDSIQNMILRKGGKL